MTREQVLAQYAKDKNLAGMKVYRLDLTWVDLGGANLRRADFGGSFMDGACLKGADLWMADFDEAEIDGTCFLGAVLDEARLEGVFHLTWSQLLGAKSYEGAQLPDHLKTHPGRPDGVPDSHWDWEKE